MTVHLKSWGSVAAESGTNGVVRRRIKGAGAELVRVEVPAGVVAPGHSHPHEQFVEVIEGAGPLTTDGVSKPFSSGDVFHFPAGTEHAAAFDKDTVLLEINLD